MMIQNGTGVEKYQYMVRATCMTYNHESYIINTMNGFTIQQTSFPVVYIIVDDASTDSNASVIEEYLKDNFDLNGPHAFRDEDCNCRRIYAQHINNKNCYFAVILLKENHYGTKRPKTPYMLKWCDAKYIAMCEGDDYWTEPLKLQMQVDFMENHPEYSLCFSNVYRKDCDSNVFVRPIGDTCNNEIVNVIDNSEDLFFAIINRKCRIPTLSTLYRSSTIESLNIAASPGFMMGDTPTWLMLSQCGRFKYFEDSFGVYCIHRGSATHDSVSRLRFTMSAKTMCVYYCNKYNYKVPRKIKNEYNRAYLSILFQGEKPEPTAFYEMFPDAAFSWAVVDNELKYRKGMGLFVIKALFSFDVFIYDNMTRIILGLKAIKKKVL